MKEAYNKVIDILYLSKKEGVEIILNGDQLQLKVDKDKIVDKDLLNEIRSNKSLIIDFLKNNDWKLKKVTQQDSEIPRYDRDTISLVPLSFSQERLWFIDRLEGSVGYNGPVVLRLRGRLDTGALSGAMQDIVDRHEVLRTVYGEAGGYPYQETRDAGAWALAELEGSGYGEEELASVVSGLTRRPFDLSSDYMLRATLISVGAADYVLVVTMHHIASDAWSMSVIVRELAELYRARVSGRQAMLPELHVQYGDYAVWQRGYLQGPLLEEKAGYWAEKLGGVSPLQLPSDYERPAVLSTRGGTIVTELGLPELQALQALNRAEGVTLFMSLLAVFKVLLYRYSGQEDISVGTSIANRPKKELEELVGFFVNTLALRDEVRGDMPFRELLGSVRRTTLEGYDHQDVPFEKVVERVIRERDPGRSPLFQVMLVLQNTPEAAQLELGGVTLSGEPSVWDISKFELTFFVTERKEGLQVRVDYSSDLYSAETAARMAGHFRTLISSAAAEPGRPVGQLPMLEAAERAQLLGGGKVEEVAEAVEVAEAQGEDKEKDQKDTGRLTYPAGKNIGALFAEQAARAPQAEALVFGRQRLTYGELNEQSNRLAHYLRGLGVGPGSLVLLYTERGAEMITGILGILKAGGAYVPVDTDLPEERVRYIWEDTNARVIVSSSGSRSGLWFAEDEATVVETDGDEALLSLYPGEDPAETAGGADPVYVIYTSGSTGSPKGVLVSHDNLADYVNGLEHTLGISGCGPFALVSTIATDLGNTVLYGALLTGGALHVFTKEQVSDSHYLNSYFSTQEIGCLKIVPSHWSALSADGEMLLPRKLLIFGGEALRSSVAQQILEEGTGCRVVNHYGPTETTIGKLLHEVQAGRRYGHTVPVGKPFSDTRAYVLDRWLQPSGTGVPGQLYIGGAGVSLGYLNNPELTAEKFINWTKEERDGKTKEKTQESRDKTQDTGQQDSHTTNRKPETRSQEPASDTTTIRLYATGDRVRQLGDGNIEYLGRTDDQVKIRGYRVELGEIGRVLGSHEDVRQAVVIAREDQQGHKRLAGYVVPGPGYNSQTVMEYLRAQLPDYMVPPVLVELEQLPLTANGKIDKRALPEPEAQAAGGYAAPESAAEIGLAALWADILEVEQVGLHDDFFELGGHSLLAVRLVSLIRRDLGAELPIGDIFDYPTVAQLAQRVAHHSQGPAVPPLTAVTPRPEHIPLSFSQERLWFIDQLEGSVQYHIPAVLRLRGKLDKAALERALGAVVDRQEALRTVIQEDGQGGTWQRQLPAGSWSLGYREATGQARTATESYIQEQVSRPFDLRLDHMLRAELLKVGEQEHMLILTLHHIASDGWSTPILVREVAALYAQQTGGGSARLPALAVQYADYALWQRGYLQGAVLEEKLSYWEEQLRGVQPLELPLDHARPAVQGTAGALHPLRISREQTRKLQQLSREQGVTLYMTLLAAFKVLLYRYSGQEDITVGTAVAGRSRQETEGLIGFFINTLALRSRVAGEQPFTAVLEAVRKTTLEAYGHQDVPFEKVVERVVRERDRSRSPLFQVMFVLQNTPEVPELKLGEVELSAEEAAGATAKFDLSVSLTESNEGLTGTIEYSTSLYEAETIARMADHLEALLESVVASPGEQAGRLKMLNAAEYRQLEAFSGAEERDKTEEGQGTIERKRQESRDKNQESRIKIQESRDKRQECQRITALFEQSVGADPNNTALIYGQEKLTYRELNERSNQLARYLRAQGVSTGMLVPVCQERGPGMVTAILGILKAGGAYVPVDPAYPQDRISYMLEDTGAELVLGSSATRDKLQGTKARVLELDKLKEALSSYGTTNLSGEPQSGDLAYVIYTSGSTGRPKGVMIEHGSLTNLLLSMQERVGFGREDRFLSVTTYSFDICYLELFVPLISGGELVLASREAAADGFALSALLERHRITHLQGTPSTWQLLLEAGWKNGGKLTMLIGGEAVREELKEALAPLGTLYNLYGPTETTIWSAMKQLEQHKKVLIGRPIDHTQVYILDKAGELSPVGVPGELCIGGAGLARGYLNRPELTAEKFISWTKDGKTRDKRQESGDKNQESRDKRQATRDQEPETRNQEPETRNQEPDSETAIRLYKTGDLARWLPDGNLEYLGRIDDQVKVRGYRIELGEIESVLDAHGSIRQSVVMAREDQGGNKRLVGYVVSEGTFDKQEIQGYLQSRLPEYMVPQQWVELEALPLTPNGKTDRRSLPEPGEGTGAAERSYEAPRNRTEEQLAEIWQELLNVNRVGIHDNFFELGGHSLLAMRLVSAIRREMNAEPAIKEIFINPTIAGFAKLLDEKNNGIKNIATDAELKDSLLSYNQEQIWFIDQLEGSVQYHIPVVLKLKGKLNVAVLAHSIQTIIARHEILRTVYIEKNAKTYQHIKNSTAWELQVSNAVSNREDHDALQQQIQEVINKPFDLSKDYMLRAELIGLGEEDQLLVLAIHQIAIDNWSVNIIIKEIKELYEAFAKGTEPALAQPALQYAAYAVKQRHILQGELLDKKLNYWTEKLNGVTELQLQGDYKRPPVKSFAGNTVDFLIDGDLLYKIEETGRKQGADIFTTLLTAFNILLHRYSGQNDICIGTSVENRQDENVKDIVGFVADTIALRNEVNSELSFADFLRQVKAGVTEAYDNLGVAFDKVVQAVVKERELNKNPLFEIMFLMVNSTAGDSLQPGELSIKQQTYHSNKATFDLTLTVQKNENNLNCSVEYSTDLYSGETIERLIGHFQQLLQAVVISPDKKIASLQLLTSRESYELLTNFNATRAEYSRNESIPSLFEAQAGLNPGAVALVFKDRQMSYGELNGRANQIARYLQAKGVAAETLVPVCIERGPEMIAGILGIMKAGGAYVPIDPEFPADRISYVLDDTAATLVLSSKASSKKLRANKNVAVIELDGSDEQLLAYPADNLATKPSPAQLGYVIYTSGSTGRPKGVMVEHINAVNYFLNSKTRFIDKNEPGTGSFMQLSYTFDASLTAMFMPLISGKTVVLSSGSGIDVFEEENFLKYAPYDFLNITPAHLELLDDKLISPAGVPLTKKLVIGGEALLASHFAPLVEKGINIGIVNLYGPTEATIGCTTYSLYPLAKNENIRQEISIGKPIDNTQIYILDAAQQPVPVGVSGELYIGGEQVARGYLNQPELTASKFVPDFFSKTAGARLYRTGDLGRWLPDGNIEYQGRIDDQVKIRGYRIELGEIESVIGQYEKVRQSVVLAKADKMGTKRLIGYVVAEDNFDKQDIQAYLQTRLPEYMVPMLWVELDSLPLTTNGKIDKRALPDPEYHALTANAYVAPRNETEQQLADMWQELLGVERVGIHDNFFELGGHSLLATRFVSLARKEMNVELAIRNLFANPTIATLIDKIESRAGGSSLPPMEPVARPEYIPLSYSQERLWFIDKLEGSLEYHIPAVLRLKGELNKQALEYAIRNIIKRHEVLRTFYREKDELVYQYIHHEDDWQLELINGKAYADDPSGLQKLVLGIISKPFNLAKDYMLRGSLVKFGEREHILCITLHHIASDGWSASILVKELLLLYHSYESGQPDLLEPLPLQYADFSIWQRTYLTGELLESKLDYWKNKLKDVAPIQLPTDFERPAIQSRKGAIVNFSVNKTLTEQLKALSRQQGATLFMTMLAAFKVWLYRYSGQNDICIGTSIAGRQVQEIEGLIGYFINGLALRSTVNSGDSFNELLGQVKTTCLEAYEHQEVSYEKVVNAVVRKRDISRSPLFDVLFILQNTPEVPALRLGDLELSQETMEMDTSKYDLNISVSETNDGMFGQLQYCTDLFKKETIERMLANFNMLLQSIVAKPALDIAALPILSAEEKHRLQVVFNDTDEVSFRDKNVLTLFNQQVLNAPLNTAVVHDGKSLTYKELDERSNQLAGYLLLQQVKREDLVPICIEPSLEMITALLGVLKAGCAYVPVDPEYPADRISYMLDDSKATIVLSSKKSRSKVPEIAGVKIISIDEEWPQIQVQPTQNIDVNTNAGQLAYVIYTSGSTGKPKGVMIEHASLANLLQFMGSHLNFGAGDKFLSVTTFSFDIAYLEIYLPLIYGGKLLLASREVTTDAFRLASMIATDAPSHMQATPSTWQMLLNINWQNKEAVKMLIGGEPVKERIKDQLAQIGDVFNVYGPTETTIWSTTKKLEAGRKVLIGKPIANTAIYVVSNEMQMVPTGVVGEICIAGDGLARGYLNQPELTAEKFITDPFSDQQGERLYKTGDLGRWLPDGNIEHLGRKDDQIKIRGYRIELGEIENNLLLSGLVNNAVVLAGTDNDGNSRLVGYVVAKEEFDKNALVSWLQNKLPQYMVPALWVQMDSMPLTPNGKIDRKVLPAYDVNERVVNDYAAPTNELEEKLAAIWRDLLHIDLVGIHDNFFELGGDSILTIQVVNKIKGLGYEIQPRDLFIHQTIAGLSAQLSEKHPQVSNEQEILQSECGLLPMQQWYLEQKHSNYLQAGQNMVLSIDKAITLQDLNTAFEFLSNHHDALRFEYEKTGGNWQQLYGTTKINVKEEALGFENTALEEDKPVKVLWQQTPAAEQYNRLQIFAYPLIMDEISWRILFTDLQILLTAIKNRDTLSLSNKGTSYRQWYKLLKQYGQSGRLTGQKAYWQQIIEGYKPLTHREPGAGFPSLGNMDNYRVNLQSLKTQSLLTRYDSTAAVGVKVVLLTVLIKILCKWWGVNEIVVGLKDHGRTEINEQININQTIGCFSNLYPILVGTKPEIDNTGLLKIVMQQLQAVPDNGLGYGVLKYLNKESAFKENNPWNIIFDYSDDIAEGLNQNDQLRTLSKSTGFAAYGNIVLNCVVTDGELVFNWAYDKELYRQDMITSIAQEYLHEINLFIDQAEQIKSDLVKSSLIKHNETVNITSVEMNRFLEEDEDMDDILSF